jgi:hypothetical protein
MVLSDPNFDQSTDPASKESEFKSLLLEQPVANLPHFSKLRVARDPSLLNSGGSLCLATKRPFEGFRRKVRKAAHFEF